MKLYKLKQTFPGSPDVGKMISPAMHEYYQFKPLDYPHLWEEIEETDTFDTCDGEKLCIGEKCYYVEGFNVYTGFVTNKNDISYLITGGRSIYSKKENAEKELNSKINVEIENETIVGENIPLFGICFTNPTTPIDNYQLGESTSLKLTIKRGSLNWRWFRNIEERDYYFKNKRAIYSREDIENVLKYLNFNTYTPEEVIDEIKNILKYE